MLRLPKVVPRLVRAVGDSSKGICRGRTHILGQRQPGLDEVQGVGALHTQASQPAREGGSEGPRTWTAPAQPPAATSCQVCSPFFTSWPGCLNSSRKVSFMPWGAASR
jgi:hypothetical protein